MSTDNRDSVHIFVDGSFSPQRNIGVGAYVMVDSDQLPKLIELSISELKIKLSKDIVYNVFENAKGSTDVEQRILEISLCDPITKNKNVFVYTDCKKTKSSDDYSVVHVKGHTKQSNRKTTDKLFDVVDKAVRKKLRKLVDNLQYNIVLDSN